MPSRPESVTPRWRAWLRLGRVLLHIFRGLLTVWWRLPQLSAEQRELRVQIWSRAMLRCLGVQLQVHGQPAAVGPILLVANHLSWLDITALHAARFCRFVSKADVRRWPLIGALASGVGTLFIERASRRDAQRVVHHMTERLRAGDVLAVFPEGTTGNGEALLPFHANLLQAAISADVPVQPVALLYVDRSTGQPSQAPCYVGDLSLTSSIWRTVRAPALGVVLVYGAPQMAQGRDRRTWAHDLQLEIERLRQSPGVAR